MSKDLVYLTWINKETGNRFKVAELYKENEMFYFKYIVENVKEAQKDGFKLLIPFPEIDKLYYCPHLFAVFGARVPTKNRPEIDKILKEYGMSEYDEFELLKRSGAKLPIDSYE